MKTMEDVAQRWALEDTISHHQLECQKMQRKLIQAYKLIGSMTETLRKMHVDKTNANEVYHMLKSAEELLPTLNIELSFKPGWPLK